MRHGSLFSGIGGFDLAAEWMGWQNVFHCEWNEFGQKILKHYWPNAISYSDITKTDFTIHRGTIDILTGGFPCQPYSSAGKRLGKEDDRHLWPEMLRTIREIQPTWVVGENVRGLTNWNGGMVFDEVQADLEAEGYEVTPFLLPACAVNAPHRRDRIWFVAYASGNGHGDRFRKNGRAEKEIEGTKQWKKWNKKKWERNGSDLKRTDDETITSNSKNIRQKQSWDSWGRRTRFENGNSNRIASDTGRTRWEKQHASEISIEQRFNSRFIVTDWSDFPTQSPVCNGDDGFSSRLDGITFPKWRSESIKAGGNAIVPQVALEIFKAIEKCTPHPNKS